MRNGEGARAPFGEILDDQRIEPAQSSEGNLEVVAGGHETDFVEVGIDPLVVVDEKLNIAIGLGLADQAAANYLVAPGAREKAELADEARPGICRISALTAKSSDPVNPKSERRTPGYSPDPRPTCVLMSLRVVVSSSNPRSATRRRLGSSVARSAPVPGRRWVRPTPWPF